jgi:hypothetical protein
MSNSIDLDSLTWNRPECGGGACGEVAYGDGSVFVRNSTKPDVAVELTTAEWRALVAAIHSGAIA